MSKKMIVLLVVAGAILQILKAPKHSTPYAEYWPTEEDARMIVAAPEMYEKHERILELADYYSLSGGTTEELMGQLAKIFNEAQEALALADGAELSPRAKVLHTGGSDD